LQKLLIAGIFILLAGFGLLIIGAANQGSSSVGGAVFIGPFPIVFGAGPGGQSLALLSFVIGAVILCLMVVWGWRYFSR